MENGTEINELEELQQNLFRRKSSKRSRKGTADNAILEAQVTPVEMDDRTKILHYLQKILNPHPLEGAAPGVQTVFTLKLLPPINKLRYNTIAYTPTPPQEIYDSTLKILKGISKNRLIELVTHDQDYYFEHTVIVLYSYIYFLDDMEFYSLLRARFCMYPPINVSPTEQVEISSRVILKIQAKVVTLLTNWFRIYQHLIIRDKTKTRMLAEFIYTLYDFINPAEWLNYHFLSILDVLVNNLNQVVPPSIIHSPRTIASVWEFFVPVKEIRSYDHVIAKQICMFDADNFCQIKMTELMHKNWTRDNKNEVAPGVVKFTDAFNRITRYVAFLTLANEKAEVRSSLYQYFITLIDSLLTMKNFNSAMSIYYGLTINPVYRVKHLLEATLAPDLIEKMKEYKELFTQKGLLLLKEKQEKAYGAKIPYLGVYLNDLVHIEEVYALNIKEQDNAEPELLNYAKLRSLSEVFQKIDSFRYNTYTYIRVPLIMRFFQNLPLIDEDFLYELSYMIYKE